MRFTQRILSAAIVVILLVAVPASAQDGDEDSDIVAEWLAEEGDIGIDGRLNESLWQQASYSQIRMNGAGDEDALRFAQVFALHNGTSLIMAVVVEDAIAVTLQFDPSHGDETTGAAIDAVRVASDGSIEDLDWDVDRNEWVPDGTECTVSGSAASDDREGFRVFEIAKPLDGDACDGFIPYGENIGARIEVETSDETFRWPADSLGPEDVEDVDEFDERLRGWGEILVVGRFGDVGSPVPNEPRDDPGQPGLETNERPGVSPFVPIRPGVDDEEGAYSADERGTPGPGLALIALVGVGALGVIAALRRER